MTEKRSDEWLDDLFPNAKAQREAAQEKGFIVAEKYLVFHGPTSDPRARELLEQWTRLIRHALVPKNASAQEYATHNALREWVEGIWRQIELAQVAQQPRARVPK